MILTAYYHRPDIGNLDGEIAAIAGRHDGTFVQATNHANGDRGVKYDFADVASYRGAADALTEAGFFCSTGAWLYRRDDVIRGLE